jgi:hypothetical protein
MSQIGSRFCKSFPASGSSTTQTWSAVADRRAIAGSLPGVEGRPWALGASYWSQRKAEHSCDRSTDGRTLRPSKLRSTSFAQSSFNLHHSPCVPIERSTVQ